jgi:hypothetical protein
MRTWRQIFGAIVRDVPRYSLCFLIHPLVSHSWIKIKNRDDQLLSANNSAGVDFKEKWTSDLYLPKIFPIFGKVLYKNAFSSHPVKFESAPAPSDKAPDVSFIIGHRGSARTPLLLKTLNSIAAQKGCRIECIVVEQDNVSSLDTILPRWVTHVFTPLSDAKMPYSRSMAFNMGARHANAEYLVFHDNDMLVSDDYAMHIVQKCRAGYSFVNLKRFIFYLSEATSQRMLDGGEVNTELDLDCIVQNAKGGGSIGASKKAFLSIGGFDERFVGWGGEDNEFWERALTQKVWSFTYLPLIHLWHAPQAEKLDFDASGTKTLYNTLSAQKPEDRIAALKNGVSADVLVDP